MRLYQERGGEPKYNAQNELQGRTHYVDDDTLRFHYSRVLNASPAADGLLYWIITSDALDMNNTRRGMRYVIFDLFGNVIERADLESSYRSHDAAYKALIPALAKIDAKAINLRALEHSAKYHAEEMGRMRRDIEAAK